MTRQLFTGIALVACFLTLAARPAHATAMLQLSQGATTISITDNLAGDLDPTVGVVAFVGTVGTYSTNIVGGLTPVPGLSPTSIDLLSLDATGTGGLLNVSFTQTGFSAMPQGGTLFWNWAGTPANMSVSGNAYLDPNNVAFGTSSIGSGTLTSSPGAFAISGTTAFGPIVNPFSLTVALALSTTGAGSYSGDFGLDAVPVPEPGSLLLLGSGLLGVAGAARRRLRARRGGDAR